MINFLKRIPQDIPEDLIGFTLGGQHVAIRLDIQPGFPGAGGDFVLDGLVATGFSAEYGTGRSQRRVRPRLAGLVMQGMQRFVQGGIGSAQRQALDLQLGQPFQDLAGLLTFCGVTVRWTVVYRSSGMTVSSAFQEAGLSGSRMKSRWSRPVCSRVCRYALSASFNPSESRPADLTDFLGVGDQGRQVLAQGGLAAGEGDVRDAGRPGLVHDGLPFGGDQFAVDALGGGKGGVCAGRQAIG